MYTRKFKKAIWALLNYRAYAIRLWGFIVRKKISQEKPFCYVALGDSTVEGIGASCPERSFAFLVYHSIRQVFKDTSYHNFGKAGAQVTDLLSSQVDKAVKLSPDLVIISVGANDIYSREKLSDFDREFSSLLDQLRKKTHALIVVNNIPDLSLAPFVPRLARSYCKFTVGRFNKRLKKRVEEIGGIHIDLYSQSKIFGKYQDLISEDGLHPSDLGHALWGNTIISVVSHVLFSNNTKPEFSLSS